MPLSHQLIENLYVLGMLSLPAICVTHIFLLYYLPPSFLLFLIFYNFCGHYD